MKKILICLIELPNNPTKYLQIKGIEFHSYQTIDLFKTRDKLLQYISKKFKHLMHNFLHFCKIICVTNFNFNKCQ